MADPKEGDKELVASLHGETAAQRQAITELLFFSSVGDLHRCKKITAAWTLPLTNPKTADYDKRTPLHLASAEGCYSVVAWLIAQNVAVNPVDRFDRTPLEDAVRGDHGEVASLLIQHGGKVMSKDRELVELADSPLAGNVRLFTDYDPDWEVEPGDITLLEKIGEGEFGVVHKARWQGTIVAVKILKDFGDMALGDFKTELNVLQKVHHPHTVQFLGAVTKKQPFMIVTEFMTGGSLYDLFKNSGFSVWRSIQLAIDCARGMAYLHNRTPHAVIHRDLKPANIMMGGPKVFTPFHKQLLKDEIGILKIADFGLSKSLKLAKPRRGGAAHSGLDDSTSHGSVSSSRNVSVTGGDRNGATPTATTTYRLTGETGSYRFMAPEVFRHEPYNNKVDVFSFAMICYQLFTGAPPFFMLDPVEAAKAVAMEHKRPQWSERNKANEVIPPKVKALVEQCWSADPEARPEFEDIVDLFEGIAREITPPFSSAAGADSGSCCSLQ